MPFKKISVIGLGYIGLPTAAMFASHSVEVIGIDVSEHVVNTINRGGIHIVEPDLGEIVQAAVEKKYLYAKNTPEAADAFLIAVPTPFKPSAEENPTPNLEYIENASRSIASVLKKGDLVVLESTSPVGTTEQISTWLAELRPDLSFPNTGSVDTDVNIAYCPERVLPGNIVRELVENDRIVGGISSKCSARAVELYQIFTKGECLVTSARTAEMAKLTENSCRDVQIAFANELSIICDKLDIDVWELIKLANRHPRINILGPGPGVGGHCIAVDPWFIVSQTPDEAKIIKLAREVNNSKPLWVIEKVKISITDFLQDNPEKRLSDVTIACYGLAFKANIDDLRESPAMWIAETISASHARQVLAVEPNITKLPNKSNNLELSTLEHALKTADIHVLLVDHDEFRNCGIPENHIVDTKGIWRN